jgi:hypothetical protein
VGQPQGDNRCELEKFDPIWDLLYLSGLNCRINQSLVAFFYKSDIMEESGHRRHRATSPGSETTRGLPSQQAKTGLVGGHGEEPKTRVTQEKAWVTLGELG